MAYLSIKQLMVKTKFSKFKSRYTNMKRDVLKTINISTVKSIKYGALTGLSSSDVVTKFRIQSFSYPQYGNYLKIKGKKSKKQRKIKHEYAITLEMSEMSINTRNWKLSVGSKKKWEHEPSQKLIRTIYLKTTKKLWLEAERKFKTKKDQAKYVREAKQNIRDKAKYLDVGDYNSRKNGINGDFYFTLSGPLKKINALFGKLSNPDFDYTENRHVFLDKHSLRVIEVLMARNILKDN